ncbi:hypothetical protein [Oxynema sp. CENA135]|nr:hypothetical protein [Oxynema sp. CENA135]
MLFEEALKAIALGDFSDLIAFGLIQNSFCPGALHQGKKNYK